MLFSAEKTKLTTSIDFTSTKTLSQLLDGISPLLDFQNANTRNTILESQCPAVPRCSNSKYRNLDGSCNHKNTQYGKSKTPFQRIMDPVYSDGRV